jgi:integrase
LPSATTEESVLQVAAVLNHAVNADPPRSEKRPVYRPLPRKQVSRPRRHRVDVGVLADILAYAAEPAKKRASLHAFVVASLCTIARPDSIVDICVAPDREQWFPGSPTLDLNPFGRAQTNNYRPVIPVMPVLEEWLAGELIAYDQLDQAARKGAGFLVNYYGSPVLNVKRSWSTMLTELKLPQGREWKPYLLRHSLATILRNRNFVKWDLKGFMGHDVTSTTETYAIGRLDTVYRALEEVLGEIDLRAPGTLRRKCAEVALSGPPAGRLRMTG